MKRGTRWFPTQLLPSLFGVILLVALTNCGGGDDEDNDVSGTYTGTIQDAFAGTGTLRATISQSGSSLSGTFQTTFPDPQQNNSGTISGTVNGSVVTLTLTPSVPVFCAFNATLTQEDDDRITGTYVAVNCSVPDSGTISITRQ
jgi:hypothetical protein